MQKILLLRYRCDVVEGEYNSIDLAIVMHSADVATESGRGSGVRVVWLRIYQEKNSRSEKRFGVCDQIIITSEVFNGTLGCRSNRLYRQANFLSSRQTRSQGHFGFSRSSFISYFSTFLQCIALSFFHLKGEKIKYMLGCK